MPTSSAPSMSPSNSPSGTPSQSPTVSDPSMTPSAVPTVSSPTELPSSMPTTSAPIQTQSVTRIDDFSSKAAMISDGWKFVTEHPGLDFIATRPSHFCQGVPDASFCGFAFPQELALQYTFSSNGRAVLEWGQSWHGGSVVVIKNGVEIAERNTIGSQTTEFDVTPGDVVEIRERDTSVINIHGLTITPGSGRRELTARLLD